MITMKEKKLRAAGYVLFVLYLILLVWIIVFKMDPWTIYRYRRYVCLIPFGSLFDKSYRFSYAVRDIVYNILVFIPFGIYISMLFERMKPAAAAAVMFTVSAAFETVQYVFSVGTTDVTDLITNTLGGIIGIVSYRLLAKLAKNSSRIDIIILSLAALVSLVLSVQMTAAIIYFLQ